MELADKSNMLHSGRLIYGGLCPVDVNVVMKIILLMSVLATVDHAIQYGETWKREVQIMTGAKAE